MVPSGNRDFNGSGMANGAPYGQGSPFMPNYMNPGQFAAGLRSTEDRNSDGYMGKRSTFSDPSD